MEMHSELPLVEIIAVVARDLARSMNLVLAEVPGSTQRAHEVTTTLGVNKVLAHRLLTAVGKHDPLATAHLIPGPAPLRRVIASARKQGVSAETAALAESAVDAFESLINDRVGDRTGLDAVISSHLPSVRSKFETTAKQSIYRGMRQIRGVSADVLFTTIVIHPGADPKRDDLLRLNGLVGVRRIRPGATFKFGVSLEHPVNGEYPGMPSDLASNLQGIFSKAEPVGVIPHQHKHGVIFGFDWGDAVGLDTARDLILPCLDRGVARRYRGVDEPAMGASLVDVHVPARLMQYDFILHDDVLPNWQPNLRILHTGMSGGADPNDETRELDLIDVDESMVSIGRGVARFRSEAIPHYTEMLTHACEHLGWKPAELRAYRCTVEYPIVGSQLQVSFERPIDPDA